VLADPGRRAELVASATARARSFSMDQLADHYLALYERVCTPAPQARGWLRTRSALRRP
jgi:hypothetical protein